MRVWYAHMYADAHMRRSEKVKFCHLETGPLAGPGAGWAHCLCDLSPLPQTALVLQIRAATPGDSNLGLRAYKAGLSTESHLTRTQVCVL